MVLFSSCQLSTDKQNVDKILQGNFIVESVHYGGFAPTEFSYKFRLSEDSINVIVTWENFIPKDINQFSISQEEFNIVKQNISCLVDSEYAKDGKWPPNFYSDYCIKSRFRKLEIRQIPVLKCSFEKHLSNYYEPNTELNSK